MSVRLNRRGATLPLTILVIAIMGVAVAITYSRISSERRITGDGQAQLDAFVVAQAGLSRFMANVNGKPPAPPAAGSNPTVTYNDLPGGTATVSLRQLRESTVTLLPAVYVITSRGTATGAKRYDNRTPPAERTVATYAMWTPAAFDLNAAYTSLSGINKAGGSGTFDGTDMCGSKPPIPGAAVPTGTYTGDPNVINGVPDNTPSPLGTGGPAGSAKDEVAIDWAGIVAGTVLPAEFVLPSWPDANQMLKWPIVRANGDLTLPDDGNGILIVTGNLTINGSKAWQGVVLVGGTITSNGSNAIRGAVISGLNVKTGSVVPPSQANGNKHFQYDSCALTRALGHVGSLQRVRNGWTDTWSSY
jgi:hypothetical protein